MIWWRGVAVADAGTVCAFRDGGRDGPVTGTATLAGADAMEVGVPSGAAVSALAIGGAEADSRGVARGERGRSSTLI